MRNALHLATVLILSLTSLWSPWQSEQLEPVVTASGRHVQAEVPHAEPVLVANETGSPRQAPGINDAVQWAVDRYRMVGLDLPELNITFHTNRSNCGGFAGLHSGGKGNHEIDICIGGDLQRRRALLHEMAHVWVSEHLDDSDRRSFLERRGLHSWNDGAVAWEKRGTEQAAMIIAWGLGDGCSAPSDLGADDESTLASSFGYLTGRLPACGRVSGLPVGPAE